MLKLTVADGRSNLILCVIVALLVLVCFAPPRHLLRYKETFGGSRNDGQIILFQSINSLKDQPPLINHHYLGIKNWGSQRKYSVASLLTAYFCRR
jgi:hypothetical protein